MEKASLEKRLPLVRTKKSPHPGARVGCFQPEASGDIRALMERIDIPI